MAAEWAYVRRLARASERLGFDLTLIAELNLNDIKGENAPCLDAWSTAAALAAVTERLELMVAVRPTFHPPALLAKQAANIDRISGGRLSLNVVSSWWAEEARPVRRRIRHARCALRPNRRVAARGHRLVVGAAIHVCRQSLPRRERRTRAQTTATPASDAVRRG